MTRYHCRGCQDPDCPSCCEAERYEDEDREPPEFGCCLPPGECCMPGLHFPSECHTAEDYERAADEALIRYERQIEARASQ